MRQSTISRLVVFAAAMITLAGCNNPSSPSTVPYDIYYHVRASWSPDGRTIAYTSVVSGAEGIYIMDSLGGNVHQLLQGEGIGLSWSPDGNWLAFYRAGGLYKMKANGDSLTSLANGTGLIRPAWSRDGSKIACVNQSVGVGIVLYDVGSSSASTLMTWGDFPSWHPTTGELVVMDAEYDPSSAWFVYTFVAVDINTLTARSLGSFATGSDAGFSPISPSGKAIAFGLKRIDDFNQIWSFDLTSNLSTKLTTDGGDFPAWSPDGTKIVYTRTQEGDGGLWVMNADGSNKRRLTKPQ